MMKLCTCGCDCLPSSSTEVVSCAGHLKLKEALQRYFKFPTFRTGQLEALLPVVHGSSNADWWRKVTLYVFVTFGHWWECYWYHCKSTCESYGSAGMQHY